MAEVRTATVQSSITLRNISGDVSQSKRNIEKYRSYNVYNIYHSQIRNCEEDYLST